MNVEHPPLAGLKLIRPRVFSDERGFFLESYREQRYAELGIDCPFVQANHSRSKRGTLRGMHFQASPGQAKLVRVARGKIFDVAVDIRPSSPTFGSWWGTELDDVELAQLFLPVGFAHGFCVLSDVADVIYDVTAPYDADAERTFAWDDPEVGVRWPVSEPLLSERDRRAPPLSDLVRRAS